MNEVFKQWDCHRLATTDFGEPVDTARLLAMVGVYA